MQRRYKYAYVIEFIPALVMSVLLHDIIFVKQSSDFLMTYFASCVFKFPNWSGALEDCNFTFRPSYLFVVVSAVVLTYLLGKLEIYNWKQSDKILQNIFEWAKNLFRAK